MPKKTPNSQTQESNCKNNNNTDDENNFIGIVLPGQRPTQKNTNIINQLSQVPGQRPTHYQKWVITLLPENQLTLNQFSINCHARPRTNTQEEKKNQFTG